MAEFRASTISEDDDDVSFEMRDAIHTSPHQVDQDAEDQDRSFSSSTSILSSQFSSLDENTKLILQQNLAAAPRPNFKRDSLAADAAYLASLTIEQNPKLRGPALLSAIRNAEEDAVEFNRAANKHRSEAR